MSLPFHSAIYWFNSSSSFFGSRGALALPYVNGYAGAVLSGEGASLIDALLTLKGVVLKLHNRDHVTSR